MKKARLSVYLDPKLSRDLAAYAERRDVSLSLVAEAAIASFLSPDAAERQEAAISKRLDRLVRQMDRLERNLGVELETLALFVRVWLNATPALPDAHLPAAQAAGRERYERFIEALGRRLAKGAPFAREIALDRPEGFAVPADVADDAADPG